MSFQSFAEIFSLVIDYTDQNSNKFVPLFHQFTISKEKVRNKNNTSNQIANRENLILDMYIISHRLGEFSVSCYCSAL